MWEERVADTVQPSNRHFILKHTLKLTIHYKRIVAGLASPDPEKSISDDKP